MGAMREVLKLIVLEHLIKSEESPELMSTGAQTEERVGAMREVLKKIMPGHLKERGLSSN